MPSERLVHIVDDVPQLEGVTDLTMVLVLDGFLDAGNAAAHAARHLADLAHGSGSVVATFDVDKFHDYRARRPAMSFVQDHYESYDAPRLLVRLLEDTGGTPYLLLHGPEPDNRWEAFARAVRKVVEQLKVSRVVAMGAVPMAVPHTRPLTLTPHANRSELLVGNSPWRGELRIPTSAQSLLEMRLGEWGHDMQGFVAHIPHYLAQLDFPQASAILLEHVEKAGRLTVDLTDLRTLAAQREDEIERYLADNSEVAEVVAALERQYDAFERAAESGESLLAPDQPLPTGEEIGLQFERFLAGLDENATMMSDPVRDLVRLLDLEWLDDDLFRGSHPDSDRPRVFGGQVAAQALVAAVRSVDPAFGVHSLHSYFLLPGDYSVPIVFEVERIRDGRSFVTRRVMARQHGRPIYYMTLSFQREEEGYDHQEPMPVTGGPEDGMDMIDLMERMGNPEAGMLAKEWGALDARYLGDSAHGLEPDPQHVSRVRMWGRIRDGLSEDPLEHLAAFTYASDVSILAASLVTHDASPRDTQVASLDHTIWFHRPFRADQWWLYDQWSPSAYGAWTVTRSCLHPGRLTRGDRCAGRTHPATS